MKADKWAKCRTCKNLDQEKSNDNWIVCPMIPLSVIEADTSENCKYYDGVDAGDEESEQLQMARALRLAVIQNQFDQGNITEDEAKELLCGPLSPGKLETIYDDSDQLRTKPNDSKQTCFECGCICDSGNICDECARDAGNFD